MFTLLKLAVWVILIIDNHVPCIIIIACLYIALFSLVVSLPTQYGSSAIDMPAKVRETKKNQMLRANTFNLIQFH